MVSSDQGQFIYVVRPTVGQDLQKCKETSNLDLERKKTSGSGPLLDKLQKNV